MGAVQPPVLERARMPIPQKVSKRLVFLSDG